jgi:DeoR family transcriptional regulator of aga operon
MIRSLSSESSAPTPISGSDKRSRRMLRILELLGEHGQLSVQELVEKLSISPATARRDLSDLDRQGLLLRTSGGAQGNPSMTEVPVHLRVGKSQVSKQRIAQRAAALLPPGPYAIAIGGGTTAAAVAHALVERQQLTIVTNSLSTANEISMLPNLRVIMTGGIVRSSSYELVGRLAEQTFSAVNIGTAFLGADGVSLKGGITTHDEVEARTNAAMIRSAERTIVVADSSKIGRATFAQVAEVGEIDDLVTDDGVDLEVIDELRSAGVRLHVVTTTAG